MSKNASATSVCDDVVAGLKEGIAWARAERELRSTHIAVSESPPVYTPEQKRTIRAKSGMSQGLFSRYLVVSGKTLQSTFMTTWEYCAAVERNPKKVSGTWVFRGTRAPVAAHFENLRDGASIDEFLDWFPGVERVQPEAVLQAEAARCVTMG